MNRPVVLPLCSLIFASLLIGCQSPPPRQQQPNLGDLYRTAQEQPLIAATSNESIDQQNLEQAEPDSLQDQLDIYTSARATLSDTNGNPGLINKLDTKIIALQIRRADELFAESPDTPEVYQSISENLQRWLEANLESPDAEELRYQLARIQSISGQIAEAESTLADLHTQSGGVQNTRQLEIDFRLAESAFSQNNYEKAVESYTNVLTAAVNDESVSKYRHQARYMRAWSYLQLNQFDLASQDFLTLLTDPKGPHNNTQMQADIDRGLILAINDAGGVTEIPNMLDMNKFEPVSLTVYRKVIEFYSTEKRWSEVIGAYRAYQTQYPDSEDALTMAIELLAFLENNQQKASLRREKAHFIQQYGSRAPKKAAEFTIELAEFHRAEALSDKDETQASKQFEQSLEYYRLYLDQYEPKNTDIRFAYGETLLEAGQLREARRQLELVAQGGEGPAGQEAAYLALTTMDDQIVAQPQNARALESDKRQAAAAFIEQFPEHEKASQVLQWLMVDRFKQADYASALEYAALAKARYPSMGLQAQQISADSLFATEKWLEAGEAYDQLQLYSNNADEKAQYKTNSVKAYYQAARASEPDVALPLLAKVYNSGQQDLAPAALYDATVIAGQDKDTGLTESLLLRYIRDYPNASNSNDARLTLAKIYKDDQQWLLAAPLLEQAALKVTDPQLRLAAHLEIADLYFQGKNTSKALKAYSKVLEDQSSNIATPTYAEASLARGRLITLYQQTDQPTKAYAAMENYVVQDLRSPQATKETRLKAEEFATDLANRQAQQYNRIQLSGNLQAAFKRKQAALETAITLYKRLESFDSPNAKTQAHAGIGNLFANLSESLLMAPVPSGLSELEQEEYMIIIEEQAYPFEEKALDAHQKNVDKLHDGLWSEGIESSLEALRQLMPARFDKRERFEGAVTHAQ